MKLQDKFIEKYGVDKLLHLVGGFALQSIIVSIATLFGSETGYMIGSFIALFLVYGLSMLKEMWLDETYDEEDIDFAMFGSAIAFTVHMLVYIIIVFVRLYL